MIDRVAEDASVPRIQVGGVSAKPRTYRELVVSRFVRHRMAMVGAILLAIILALVLLGQPVSPYDPHDVDIHNVLLPPSVEHPLGTDDLGRDEASRILSGGRVSLAVGLIASMVSVLIGCTVGGISGFYGGFVDNFLMRVTDSVLCFPWLFTMMIFAAIFGKGLLSISVAVGLLAWPIIGRIVRASFLSIKQEDFIVAAYSVGATDLSIMFRHILPNSMGPILVAATLLIGEAMMYESALSYLGLGIQPPTASWGNMLSLAQNQLRTAPWLSLFPGLMIFLSVLSINLVGDGLRDALDPRQFIR